MEVSLVRKRLKTAIDAARERGQHRRQRAADAERAFDAFLTNVATPVTRQVAELTVRDGVLYTDRTGGARVEAIGARRARLVGQPLELEYDSAAHPGYVVRWSIPNRRADRFIWKAPVAPVLDRAALGEYAGTYASAELGSTYVVEEGDSTLVLRAGTTPGLVARAVFPDGFVSGQYTIQFVRRAGRVTGFEISHPRARGVEFAREP